MPESQIKVEYNYHCGTDLDIVNAARRSFGKKSHLDLEKGHLLEKDKKLLEFLARGMSTPDWEKFVLDIECASVDHMYWGHPSAKTDVVDLLWKWRTTPTHDTPFNHCFISFDVAAPIFVRAQLVKHEYLILSEFSRRYMTDDVEFYTPDTWRSAPEDKKQGSGQDLDWLHVPYCYEYCISNYKFLLGIGAAPEQARMVLPQSLMTSWTWSGTLGAFAKMCTLRLDPHAQYETRLVAQQVYSCLKRHFPVSAPLLVEGVK